MGLIVRILSNRIDRRTAELLRRAQAERDDIIVLNGPKARFATRLQHPSLMDHTDEDPGDGFPSADVLPFRSRRKDHP